MSKKLPTCTKHATCCCLVDFHAFLLADQINMSYPFPVGLYTLHPSLHATLGISVRIWSKLAGGTMSWCSITVKSKNDSMNVVECSVQQLQFRVIQVTMCSKYISVMPVGNQQGLIEHILIILEGSQQLQLHSMISLLLTFEINTNEKMVSLPVLCRFL